MSKRAASNFLPAPAWFGLLCAICATVAVGQMGMLDGAAGRMVLAALVVLFYLVFCVVIFLGHQRKQRAAAGWQQAGDGATADDILVVFASQTGFAAQLALQTAQALKAAGMSVRMCELANLGLAQLQETRRILFVLSTTGEGDAPDSAAGFARKVMGPAMQAGRLRHLRYGMLALGDRNYAHYCAFGRAMDAWLHHQGAQALFDMVEVDNGDTGALRHWQHHLGVLSGHTEMADWSTPNYQRWCLAQRRLLNHGSMGAPAFHLAFVPADASQAMSWQAGDIAEIGPCNAPGRVASLLQTLEMDGDQLVAEENRQLPLHDFLSRKLLPHDPPDLTQLHGLTPQELADRLQPLPHREYSIASLPADGRLELLVRQTRLSDGSLGLGSGWLTACLEQGAELDLRVRENRSFHPPAEDIPLILIGNGTGLAGLRAQLKARIAAGRRRNWLLFGERSSQHDFFHREEIERWQAQGMLQRLDLAFSRDQAERIYVQDRLHQAAASLRDWVDDGAAIYVCGSLDGMATGVAQVLQELLGEEMLDAMAAQGRYRRDVY